jgi:hypothetical protein
MAFLGVPEELKLYPLAKQKKSATRKRRQLALLLQKQWQSKAPKPSKSPS